MNRRRHILSLLIGPAAAKAMLASPPKPAPAVPAGPVAKLPAQQLPPCNFNITSSQTGMVLFSAPLDAEFITLSSGDSLIVNMKIEVE